MYRLQQLLTPPQFNNIEETRRASLLQIIIIMVGFYVLLSRIPPIAFYDRAHWPFIPVYLVTVPVMVGLVLTLIRRGMVQFACTVCIIFVWLDVTSQSFLNGVDTPINTQYLLVIAIAGLLLGANASIVATLFSFLTGSLLFYAESRSFLTIIPYSGAPVYQWWTLMTQYVLLAAILTVSSNSIEMAFLRLRKGNQKLHLEINDRTKAQAALQESEQRFRNLLETMTDLVWEVDATGRFSYISPQIQSIFGHSADSLINTSPVDLVITESRHEIVEFFRLLKSNPAPFALAESRIFHTDGHLVVSETSGVPIYTSDGTFAGYRGVTRDITSRKRAEETIQQIQRLDSIGLLASGIAHDFNNMLTGIMAQASLASAKLPPSHPARHHVDRSVQSAERAADLTRQLLAYAGKGRVDETVLDLSCLLRDNVELIRTTLPKKALFETNVPQEPLYVWADHAQMQQVIMNLVINAGESLPEPGGQVTATAQRVQLEDCGDIQHFLGAEALMSGDYVRLTVSDTGKGIDEESLSRIFDPFFTTKEMGHGLGLSATLGIVRSHDGAIYVQSKPDHGTTFTILLPLCAAPQEAIAPPKPNVVAQPALANKILIIDDEEPIREAVADILTLSGMELFAASNGREGVELYKLYRDEIGLVLLDMQMPIMNGEETFLALSSFDPNVKVILSSGYDESESNSELVAGAVGFLKKPYNIQTLQDKVHGVLGAPRPLLEAQ